MNLPRPLSPPRLSAALVLAAATLFWWLHNGEPRAGARAVFIDLINYYYPMADLAAKRLSAGELPLWNPGACSGIPLLATLQVGVFYPANWLSIGLGAEAGLSLSMYLHCVLGGWFACWAFRAGGSEWPSSAFGGVLFVFACVVGETGFPAQAAAIVWLPWLVLCVERIAREPSLRWWVGLAAGTALQLLAGFPQFVLLSFYLVGAWAVVVVFEQGPVLSAGRRRTLGAMAVAVALGVGLAGVQLGPSLELAGESVRAETLEEAEVHYLGSDVPSLAGLLRNAVDPAPRRLTFDYGPGAGYLGVAAIFLGAAGLVAGRRRRSSWLLVVVAVVSLLLSDGYRGAAADLYRLYAATPGGALFRTPERFRLLYLFCVIALAVRGFDELARGFPSLAGSGRSVRGRVLVGLALLAIADVVVILGPIKVVWRVGVLLVLVSLVLRRPESESLRRFAAVACLGFVVLDLGLAVGHHGFFRRFPTAFAEPPPTRFVSGGGNQIDSALVARLGNGAGYGRVELLRFMPKLGAGELAGLRRVTCFEPLVPAQWPALFAALGSSGGSGLATIWPDAHPGFYDVASVGRIAMPGRGGVVRIDENPDALPRAYLVERVVQMSQAEIFAQLAAGELDYRGQVALEVDPGWSIAPGDGEPGEATISSYAAGRVVVDVRSARDAVLVLTDSHYPGWRATVDGEEVGIVRANGLFRAVAVPAGSHRVAFEYAPTSLRVGAAASLTSVAVVAALAVVSRRRRGGSGLVVWARGETAARS